MSSYLRYLRIAFSAMCGVLCLLLIVLWVRSYWQWDALQYEDWSESREVTSQNGFLLVDKIYQKGKGRWWFGSDPAEFRADLGSQLSINWDDGNGDLMGSSVTIPHWLIVLFFVGLGIAPWTRRRYSLRTLLVFMTGIAALLGILVHFSTH
jgi:hypothetical protein